MKKNPLLKMYEGAFEDWKAQLALSRIKALGFPQREWEDLMQEAAIVILQFKHDPQRAGAASEETALFAAINRHLLSLMRKHFREEAKFERHLARLGIRPDGTGLSEATVELDVALEIDVRQAVEGLSEFDQAVCKALSEGLDRGQTGRRLGCDWHTVAKAVGRIRQHFEERGVTLKVLS